MSDWLKIDYLACPWTVSKRYSALLGGHSTWYFGPILF